MYNINEILKTLTDRHKNEDYYFTVRVTTDFEFYDVNFMLYNSKGGLEDFETIKTFKRNEGDEFYKLLNILDRRYEVERYVQTDKNERYRIDLQQLI